MNKQSKFGTTVFISGLFSSKARNIYFAIALASVIVPAAALAQQQQPPSTAVRLNELGPENTQIAQRAGIWDVVETSYDSSGAVLKTGKAVAERRMIGSFLQEILRPALGSDTVLRIDYLSFNRVEGRWKYVSMDTRVAVGLMPAASFGRGEDGRIEVTFEPFSLPETGQLLQMNQIYILQDSNRDRKDQRFVVADGSGKTALLHRYEYVRRAGGGGGTAEILLPSSSSGTKQID